MLDDFESNLKTVKFFVQHFGCSMMLYRFARQGPGAHKH